jgi:26S proteasome regulatory subunit T6
MVQVVLKSRVSVLKPLRERRVHVTQEDFEMAVAKVLKKDADANMSIKKLFK